MANRIKSFRRAKPADEATQESLALLGMLAQSNRSIREGRYKPVSKAFHGMALKVSCRGQDIRNA